jgi:TonB family protein
MVRSTTRGTPFSSSVILLDAMVVLAVVVVAAIAAAIEIPCSPMIAFTARRTPTPTGTRGNGSVKRNRVIPCRSSRVLLVRTVAAVLLALVLPARAAAQNSGDAGAPTDAGARADRDEVHAPELVEFVKADYPAAALEARTEGTVVLRLTIDVAGRVAEAKVMQPAGNGFDEAASAAALRFRFAPARRGDTPVRVRILYRYEFRLPAPPPSGDLMGTVTVGDHGRTRPAVGAEVTATTVDGASASTRTDANGRFRFEGLRTGACRVVVRSPGLGEAESRTEVAPGVSTRVVLRLEPAAEKAPLEVTVRGQSEAERRRQSAEAVTVIENEQAKRESSDLGEVLARTQGVGVRRAGGLGSGQRFSLNGLTDDQVRFFLDGVPLELAGYPFGVANVPVNLIERIEIYSGVVPVRFGADALGGAVNLVTDDHLRGHKVAASYEVGSFDTHRLTLFGRYQHEPTGFFARATGFFDYARNNYPVDVEAPDERGRLSPVRVYRFHDAYRAGGGNAEVGLVDRPWAKRLLLRVFVTDYDKDYQHNVVMTVPYGEVNYAEMSSGASLRYEQPLGRGVSLSAFGGYAYTRSRFLDVATCVYDWFGRCVRDRTTPGETDTRPHDQVYWDHSGFGRVNLSWRIHPAHALRLSLAPTYLTRTGDERRQSDPDGRDPLTAARKLLTFVNGVEYQLDLLRDRLQNILFVKEYVQILHSEEPRPGGVFRQRDRDTHRFGVGDGLRFRFTPWLYAKASYEWATRLPRPDEVFGDNAFVIANLELEPETSHNVNLGLTLDARDTPSGSWRATVNGFLRDAHQLIVLLGNDRVQSYQNVFGARSLGVEGAVGWTSPSEYLVLDANATYVDLRNTSSEGAFGDFEGDRIPNRPYLFANASARLQLRRLFAPGDELSLTWNTRYVHKYFRGWESVGAVEFKQVIPAQLVHGVGLGYLVRGDHGSLSTTLEVQNLTDAPVFDLFGVQRPGRAFFGKTTAEF